MKSIKLFIIFTFLLAFAFQVSAQDQTPKIVWKNLQEKYERFEDIKPVIVNSSSQPIYFACSDSKYGSFPTYSYDLKFKLLFNNVGDNWDWNVFYCGTESIEKIKNNTKREKQIKKLKQQGKYIPEGCKLEPNQEYTIRFSNDLWKYIVFGEGSAHYSYGSGKYKFTLEYDWANSENPSISESSAFDVNLKKETN